MSDLHLEKVPVNVNMVKFNKFFNCIEMEINRGMHSTNNQHLVNAKQYLNKLKETIDTVENNIQEVVTCDTP